MDKRADEGGTQVSEEWLKPSAAAQRLQMPASTLRVYSTKFASLLSPAASDPPTTADGKRGSRLYSSTDIAVLARAKEQLAKGMTYEQVLQDLRMSIPGARQRAVHQTAPDATAHPNGPAGMTQAQLEAMVSGMIAASVANTERMMQAWQSLAEERAKEIVQLRARIRELEEERRPRVEARNPGLLAKLFGV